MSAAEDPVASPPRPGGSAPAPPAGTSGSILVVDDNEANLDALSRRLERRGYRVETAKDGPAALEAIAARPFDLVMLDVMMPGMSGLEVLAKIRETRLPSQLPVIMATAKDQSEDVVKAFVLGANDYVTKPLDFAVVSARVRTQVSLAHSVRQVVELEQRLSQRNAELETANAELLEAARRTRQELDTAARVQEALLPKSLPAIEGLSFAWAFKPCQQLAGDSLNVCALDDEHVGVYVLDVAGHGVAASLLAVAASRILSPRDHDSILIRNAGEAEAGRPVPPAEVADRLDRRFPWDPATEQFVTMFYAVVHAKTRKLTYVSAGHPGALRLRRGAEAAVLEGSGMPIGLGDRYEQQSVQLEPGDRVYLYSDGITEAMNPNKQLFGSGRLSDSLERGLAEGLQESVALLLRDVDEWCGGRPSHDDVSVLALECS